MQRAMTGFHQDAQGHWVAELICGHTQHVRHQPPFTLRPWVLTSEGRAERVGQFLECASCDRREMPPGHVAYKRTNTFTQGSVPPGLLRQHETKAGVWGLAHVVEGALEFVEADKDGERRETVTAGQKVVIRPEVSHRVIPLGHVQFFVEFWQAALAADTN